MREGHLGRWERAKKDLDGWRVSEHGLLMYQLSLHQIISKTSENNFFLTLSVMAILICEITI